MTGLRCTQSHEPWQTQTLLFILSVKGLFLLEMEGELLQH